MLRRPFLFRFFSLGGFLLHQLNRCEAILDVLVLAAFDRAVRLVHAVSNIVHKHSVNSQHGIFVALRLHHVAHGERSNIAAVFEVSRIERLLPHLIEDLATLRPCLKHRRGRGRDRSRDVLVFVVFLGSPDQSVLRHVFHNLRDFRLRQGNVDDQAGAILKNVLFAAMRGERRRSQQEKCCRHPEIT